jgi:hypothetical protein
MQKQFTMAEHDHIEFQSKGHLIEIDREWTEDESFGDKPRAIYAVQVDGQDFEGFIYASLKEAKEAVPMRIGQARRGR